MSKPFGISSPFGRRRSRKATVSGGQETVNETENLVKTSVDDMTKAGHRMMESVVEKTRKPRTRMPTLAGIFDTITGVFALIGGLGLLLLGGMLGPEMPMNTVVLAVVLIIIGIVATVGGIYALTRGRWVFAVVGAVFAAVFLFFLGIPAVIFTSLAKDEFEQLR